MLERLTSTSPFARVLRVVLVFALVFWSSFNVEMLAFAAMYADSGAGHEPGTLSNLAVWEVQKAKEVNEKGETVDTLRPVTQMRDVHDTAAGEEQKAKPELQVNGSMQFVALPTWVAKPTVPDNPSQGGADPNPDNPDEPSQGGTNPDEPNPDNPNSDNPNPDNPNPENPNPDNPDNPGTDTPSPETPNPEEPAPENPNPEQPNNSGNATQTQAMPAATRSMPAAGQNDQGLTAQADDSTNGASSSAAEKPKEDVVIADFVEWKVGEGEEEIATVKVENGVATLTAHKAGKVTVTCSLKESANNLVAATFVEEFPDKPFEASFTVTVSDAKPLAPYVQSIDLYLPDGTMYSGTDPVTVPKDQAGSYTLHEKVNTVLEPSADAEPTLVPYDCTYSRGLAVASGGRFADLTWRAENPDGTEASKDDIEVENGVIKLKGSGTYTVWCISAEGRDGSEYKTSVKVRLEGAKEDPQGEYNPQSDLTVEIDVPEVVLPSDEGNASGASADANADTKGNGSATGQKGMSTQAEGDSPSAGATDSSKAAASDSSASANSGSASASSPSADSAKKTLASTSKTYSISELDAFTLKPADGKPIEYAMGGLHVKGSGPTLSALIYRTADPDGSLGLGPNVDAGQKPLDIESVDFVIDGGKSITVPWTDLVAVSSPNNIILATESLVVVGDDAALKTSAVEGEGDEPGTTTGGGATSGGATDSGITNDDGTTSGGATSSDDATTPSDSSSSPAADPTSEQGSSSSASPSESGSSASPSGLLPNTRFRLLYNGLGAGALDNPDSFRYINKIIVHVKGEQIKPVDPVDTSVYIAYTPVRKGEWARLIPQFTLPDPVNGGSVQFHYDWQWSATGEPDSWQPIDKNSATDKDRGQQLEVLTNDETIGTWRRFILTVTLIDGTTKEQTEQVRESLPKQIEEGSGFRVLLDYVPPVAGDVANFTAIPQNDPKDKKQVELEKIYYEWQMSTDYGLTWIGEGNKDWPDLLKKQSGVGSATLKVPTKKVEEKPATEPGSDKSDDSASKQNQTQLIWIRVVAHHDGEKTPSDPAPLTVHVGDTSGGKKADEIKEEMEKGSVSDNPPVITEINNLSFEDSPTYPDDGQPSSQPTTTYGGEPTSQPSPQQSSPSQVYVNDAVSERIAEQQAEAKNKPGARWTELSSINPTDEDVKNILGINPFAPFAGPAALGLTVAGGLEKLIGFRRQTR